MLELKKINRSRKKEIKVPSEEEIELIAGRHYYTFEEGFVAFILGCDWAIKRIKELNR